MDMEKLRLVTWPVFIFVVLAFAGWLALSLYTSSPSIIRVEVVTQVTSAAAQTSQDATAEDSGAADVNPVSAQLESYQQSVFAGLSTWMAIVFVLGALLSIGWAVFADLKQRSVYGPTGQGSAMGAWVLALLVLMAIFGATYFYLLAPLALTQFITPGSLTLVVGAVGLAALAGYWLATLLAASPVMRPSVPFSINFGR